MDRAHRIGQKRVVNVYRLITKGTLEEKIMRYMCSVYVRVRERVVCVCGEGRDCSWGVSYWTLVLE